MIVTPATSQNRGSPASTSPLFASSSSTPSPERQSSASCLSVDQYYSNKTFSRFFPVAGIYAILVNLALLLLKPLPHTLREQIISSSPRELLPADRFMLSAPATDSPSSSQTNTDGNNVVIVTGSNTGIGFETAASLVELGYDVILACRSRDKGEQAVTKINSMKSRRGKAIFLHPLDLSSLESVRSFAGEFTAKYNHLNILINNAGINSTGKSIDGMDLCFQTNFVGHYLLTRMLVPQLLNAKNKFPSKDGGIANNGVEAGRVVNLSSVTHHFADASEKRRDGVQTSGKHDEEWWRGCAKPFVSNNTYKESKMAALLLTQELNKRYGSQGLRAVSANPGSVNSDIWRNYPSYMMKVHDMIYLTAKQGSSTSFAAAVGDLPKEAIYLQPYWQPWGKKCKESSVPSFHEWFSLPVPFSEMMGPYIGYAITDCRLPSPEASTAMWNVCEELVGLKETSM